ncbi:MAG: alpha/beta hydrolase [Alcanivorax sp.]|nr:alpha/beta hydrolase [Alcanivorax sp.]
MMNLVCTVRSLPLHLRHVISVLVLLGLASCTASSTGAGPATPAGTPTGPAMVPDALQARDGTLLPLSVWLPDAHEGTNGVEAGIEPVIEPLIKGTIIGLHSFGDYRAAFDHIGPWFAQQGYAFYSWDQRGFGSHDDAGHWPGRELLVSDLEDAITLLADQHPGPLYLLGESMGGGVAMITLAENPALPVDGLILAAPSVREGLRTRYLWNAGLAVGATLMPGHTFNLTRDAADPRYTPHSAARLATDPQILLQVRMDTYRQLIRFTDYASDIAPALQQPILLLYGGNDDLIPAVSIDRLRRHQPERLSYRFYPEAPHLLLQGAHWQHYTTDMLTWLHQDFPAPESDGTGSGHAAANTRQ